VANKTVNIYERVKVDGVIVDSAISKALPRSGPFLHVHHREDEWYYVLSGEFIFRAGGEQSNLSTGGSIWLPRGIPRMCGQTQRQPRAS